MLNNNLDRFKFRVFWKSKNSNHSFIEEVNVLDFANNEARLDINNIPEVNEAGGCDPLEFNLDECVLMQSTGLCDKNEKLIYEGDILSYEDINYLLEWSNENGGFVNRCLTSNHPDYDIYGFYGDSEDFEVIGNIHENPELLTKLLEEE